jgi:hypothetical protein
MNVLIVQAIVRHLLTAVGGGLVANGVVDSQSMEAITGGIIAVTGLAWSVYDKYSKKGE